MYCGLVGTGLMVIAAIYPVFRRIKLFRWFASNTMWFDFHMMAGTVGPMFIILHSWWKLDNWVSAPRSGRWSIVVVSGVLGRYLYTQVPGAIERRRARGARSRARVPDGAAALPGADGRDRSRAHEQRAKAQRVATSPSVLRAMWWLIFQDIGRIPKTFARRGRLAQLGVDPDAQGSRAPCGRMIVIARRQVVAPKAQLLLHSWKKVHVPFTVILTGFAVGPHLGSVVACLVGSVT